ncbi:hypothetical protein IGI37_001607 [Enterococcus sp. AZ194]|uniref:GNAT family N-acetyltransferase n=1 Tax=Enterococcus sp. AZ194 TaxID=2774629 RepID=UPI003F237B9B
MNLFIGNEEWLKAAAFYIRYQVFVLEQKISPEEEFDALDYSGDVLYLVCFEEDKPIATLRYQKLEPHVLNPDRFCVSLQYRGQGIGRKLLLKAEAQAKKEGCNTSVLSAEEHAYAFYQKLGYQVCLAPYIEDGVSCVKMVKQLL